MKTCEKYIYEIADFLFANPGKKISEEISVFCSKFQKTERTVWTYVKKAQKYNMGRIQAQEKIKDEILSEQTKENIKLAILTRNERLELLSKYAKGTVEKIGDELIIPSHGDRIRAISEINKMQGDYAVIKTDITSDGERIFDAPLTPERRKEILQQWGTDAQ